jgi:hypothetical protein
MNIDYQIEDILDDNINLNHLSKSKELQLEGQPEFVTFPIYTKRASALTVKKIFEALEDENREMTFEENEQMNKECGCTFITLSQN